MKKVLAYLFLPYPAAFVGLGVILSSIDAIRLGKSPCEIIVNDVPPPGYLWFFLIVFAYQTLMGSLPIFIASKLRIMTDKHYLLMAIALSGITARNMWVDCDVFFIVSTAMAFALSALGYVLAWKIIKQPKKENEPRAPTNSDGK